MRQPKDSSMTTGHSPLLAGSNLSLIAGAVILAAMVHAFAPAQQLAQSGSALDSNLQLGSGGYNGVSGRAASPMQRDAFDARRGTQMNMMRYNAFQKERRYRANRGAELTQWSASTGTPTESGQATTSHATSFDDGYAAGRAAAAADDEQARRQMELLSYGIGFYLGEEIRAGLEADQYDADKEALVTGFQNGVNLNRSLIPADDIARILAELERRMANEAAQRLLAADPEFQRLHDENGDRSRAFLESFASRDGVERLPSGILYDVIVPGDGPTPEPGDTIVISYRLMALDGTVRSEAVGETLDLDAATDGGAEILATMPVGSKWLIAIPADLAYGAAGRPPEVGPNEAVYGEVELIEIKSEVELRELVPQK